MGQRFTYVLCYDTEAGWVVDKNLGANKEGEQPTPLKDLSGEEVVAWFTLCDMIRLGNALNGHGPEGA